MNSIGEAPGCIRGVLAVTQHSSRRLPLYPIRLQQQMICYGLKQVCNLLGNFNAHLIAPFDTQDLRMSCGLGLDGLKLKRLNNHFLCVASAV